MKNLVFALTILLFSNFSFADTMITKTSNNSVAETLNKLEKIVAEKGFGIVARVNHAAAAEKSGLSLRPTEVLIFGNPKVGTALMSSNQTIGLDLPIKVLAWEDADGVVSISYNDPAWMVSRHGIDDKPQVVEKMSGALKNFTDAAAK